MEERLRLTSVHFSRYFGDYLGGLWWHVELQHVASNRFNQGQTTLFPFLGASRLIKTLRGQIIDDALLSTLDDDLGQFRFTLAATAAASASFQIIGILVE